jgi:uncharacterized paraquat-inducible protein A
MTPETITNKLQPCPDCGNRVSRSATSCPHCGHKLKTEQTATGILAAIIIALIIGGILYFLIAG